MYDDPIRPQHIPRTMKKGYSLLIPTYCSALKNSGALTVKRAASFNFPKHLKPNTVIVAATNDFQRLCTLKEVELTSIANSTPPIGAPNVAVTPTATAAVMN